jgi:hypothetical protein
LSTVPPLPFGCAMQSPARSALLPVTPCCNLLLPRSLRYRSIGSSPWSFLKVDPSVNGAHGKIGQLDPGRILDTIRLRRNS